MRTSDLVTSAVCLLVGALMLYESIRLELFLPSGQTGPGFFPAALSGTLMLLAVLLGMAALRTSTPQRETTDSDQKMPHRPLIMWLLLAASVLVFEVVGFVVAMILLMAALTIGLERRRLVGAIVASVIVPAVMFYIFGMVLDVRLPSLLIPG